MYRPQQSVTSNSKYRYYIHRPLWFKLRIIFSWLGIVLAGIGLSQFYRLYPLPSLPFAFAYFYGFFYLSLSYWITLRYPRFPVLEHERLVAKFTAGQWRPSVDIFLPVCGEPLAVLRRTWEAVAALDYIPYTPYVLDDKGNPEVEKLAREFGFTYLSRRNRGYLKKAGNLRYAFARTNGEFIVIFDADFAPTPEFLTNTLPYLQDSRRGIVQTPQCFAYEADYNRRRPLSFAAAQVQEDFYRINQVARGTLRGSICVGSNAVYRRAALRPFGGSARVQHSEDVHTGFNLVTIGYEVFYLPLCLAFGDCPDELGAWIKQQMRWCQGSLSLLTSGKFWRAQIGLSTKLTYFSGFLYYNSGFFKLLAPFFIYVVFYFEGASTDLESMRLFWPLIVSGWLVFPFFRTRAFRPSFLYAYWLLSYIHAYTIFSKIILGRENKWVATNSGGIGAREKRSVLGLITFNLGVQLILAGLCQYAGVANFFDLTNNWLLVWVVIEVAKNAWLLLYTYTRVEPFRANFTIPNLLGRSARYLTAILFIVLFIFS